MAAHDVAAVLGSGPGGLTIAADLTSHGWRVRLADFPEFSESTEAVRANGGVTLRSSWSGDELVTVAVADSIGTAVDGARLVVVSAPTFAHERFLAEALPHLERDVSVVFVGEGGGTLVAWPLLVAAGRTDVHLAETNCLPYMAKRDGAATVLSSRKQGGVLLAGMPASSTQHVLSVLDDLWPYAEPADSVWQTVLVNYDAIDIVPVALANAATLEARPGGMVLWGEGATDAVVRVIEAVDGELLALRAALGVSDRRRYRDFLIAQGLAPDVGDLYTVMRAGGIVKSVRPSGSTEALRARLELDVAYTLVLAADLAHAVGLETPVIHGCVALAGAMLATDFRSEGRTLRSLGLEGRDKDALVAYVAGGAVDDVLAGAGGLS